MLLPLDLQPPISRAEITARGGDDDRRDPRERPVPDGEKPTHARGEHPKG